MTQSRLLTTLKKKSFENIEEKWKNAGYSSFSFSSNVFNPSKILVESAFQISCPLCRLYNLCLDKCVLPSAWKTSLVCSIFKSGDRSIPSNYRPVSLLNTMEKVLERILYKHIFNHLKRNNFFTPCQSVFLPGDSTVNQLTYLYNRICSALDSGPEIRMVFFLY